MRFHRFIYTFLFTLLNVAACLSPIAIQAQSKTEKENFKAKVAKMHKTLLSNPDEGYKELKALLAQAEKKNLKEPELVLLANTCWYYLLKSDFDNVIKSSNVLQEKALEYKSINYQAVAHTYLCQIYVENDLREKALNEYELSIKILEQGDSADEAVIGSKANAHTYIANLYYKANKIDQALEKLALARKQLLLHKDPIRRKSGLYRNYANTGTLYEKKNLDSAQYYIQKSIALCQVPKGTKDFIVFLNYSILGDICLKKKEFKRALEHYTNAENSVPPDSDLNNRKSLYQAMIKTYSSLGDSVSTNIYRNKLNEVKLKITDNKNKSLHTVIKQVGKKSEKIALFYIVSLIGLLIICTVLLYVYIKKVRVLKQSSTKANVENVKSTGVENRETIDKTLIAITEKNPTEFITEFNTAYPYFKEKLTSISNNITDSEVEICAYLKLNLTTKDIARIKNLEPKTIQNRKYRIRKKLNVPNETDIYFYFNIF